ncbi:MAG: phage portal protein [Desulfurellales bacterium]|nr:MAG: phage portal protein [Desulfurellales bacterium]
MHNPTDPYGYSSPAVSDLHHFYGRNATFGTTSRYREATLAEAYYLGLQYEHLKPWNTKGVALESKKPKIIEPLYKRTVHALDDFIWSGHRFPRVVVSPTWNSETNESDIGPALDLAESSLLTRFVNEPSFITPLRQAIREATRKAIVCRSAALIIGARAGHLRCQVENGKHCTPTFSKTAHGMLESLEIVYQFQREDPSGGGSTRTRWYWYRRTITTTTDTVYKEEPVFAGKSPEWIVDPDKTVAHNLGICPVVWVRTLPESEDAVDGVPVIDPQLYSLIDAINYTLSQRNRAVQYGGDPQPIRTGVDEADRANLNKEPGSIWDLPQGGSFQFAEIQGAGAERASSHIQDLTQRFYSAVRVVLMDPQALSGDISGRVLELIHGPMVGLAGSLREDLGDVALCRAVCVALRMICTLNARGETVMIPGVKRAAQALTTSQTAGMWLDPPVSLQWRPFFAPSVTEQQQRLSLANEAVSSKLITKETALNSVADIFNILDPRAELEAVKESTKKPSVPPPPIAQADQETEPKEPEEPEIQLMEEE